jgi:hypothetical protein
MARRLVVAVTDHTYPARTQTAGVRVCNSCGRPLTARDKNEYTPARARLVADMGLCVCPGPAPAGGPSLL